MLGQTYDCPACDEAGYDKALNECPICRGKGRVEDGGPSVAYGDKAMRPTDYIGSTGCFMVINLPTPDKN